MNIKLTKKEIKTLEEWLKPVVKGLTKEQTAAVLMALIAARSGGNGNFIIDAFVNRYISVFGYDANIKMFQKEFTIGLQDIPARRANMAGG